MSASNLSQTLPFSGLAKGVGALMTTRKGGVSMPPYGQLDGPGFNVGNHVGDQPSAVATNRRLLAERMPNHGVQLRQCLFMEQVHGTDVFDADFWDGRWCPRADAAVTTRGDVALVVMVADCLPVLIFDELGKGVAVAHAGWRGLSSGVLEKTVAAICTKIRGAELQCCLGAAIGCEAFVVGEEVRAKFVQDDRRAAVAFMPTGQAGKYRANLRELALQRLRKLGVTLVDQIDACTFNERERFFSFRRDGVCGRMAAVLWRGDK